MKKFEIIRRNKDALVTDSRYRWTVTAKNAQEALTQVRETYAGDEPLEDEYWELEATQLSTVKAK